MLIHVTIPVLNEEAQLAASVATVRAFLKAHSPAPWELVIADNGSTDRTNAIAHELAREHADVRVLRLAEPGRGRALRRAWTESQADILSYMDVDLSTDLKAWPALIDALTSGGFDIAVGSRALPASEVTRGSQRELLSRGYRWLARTALGTRLSDLQCGFKAISRRAADALLPRVQDEGWFFDTELLVLAEREGWRIREVPVCWMDDPDSRVKLLPTIWGDCRGILRLRRTLRQAPRPNSPPEERCR